MQLVIETVFSTKLVNSLAFYNKEFEVSEKNLEEKEELFMKDGFFLKEDLSKSAVFLADHLGFGCEQGVYVIELKNPRLKSEVVVRLQ